MKVVFVKAIKFEAKSGEYFYYIVVNEKLEYLNYDPLPKVFLVSFDYGEKLIANRFNIHKGYDKKKDREFLYIPKLKAEKPNDFSTDPDLPF